MTQEEKQLLLADLCARLPYGVKCRQHKLDSQVCTMRPEYLKNSEDVEEYEPYLRPMSSMTVEDWLKLQEWIFVASDTKGKPFFGGFRNISAKDTIKAIDYFMSHHFDYRGLIEKGLALEAPKDMYKTE